MAHGEMDRDQFAAFNCRWMDNALLFVMNGGLLATFIDWRSVEIVLACGRDLDLDRLNIIVWSKPNAGQGSLWRSAHELLAQVMMNVFKRKWRRGVVNLPPHHRKRRVLTPERGSSRSPTATIWRMITPRCPANA